MKRKFIPLFLLVILFLPASCLPPTPKQAVENFSLGTPNTLSTSEVYISPTDIPEENPVSLENVNFLTKFSDKKADWQIIPGSITAAQVNAEVAKQETDRISRSEQKVINGFVRSTVTLEDGQVFEILSPAELVDGKLMELKIKNVGQVPILSSHAVLLEDYFEINFPDVVKKWKSQGAQDKDIKYAAIITVTWATKFGPLRISYKVSGKYITEEGKYPGRVDFLRLCMYEQTQEHILSSNRLGINLYPVPIVGLSGTAPNGATGEMKSDFLGWTPMTDFAKAEDKTLNEIGQAVNGVIIESEEILGKLQTAFNRTFMPVHCNEAMIQ